MIKAVILDMDGLMIDSQPFHQKAFDKVFKSFGKELTVEDNTRYYVGISDWDSAEDMIKRYDLPISAEALVARKQAAYLEFLKQGVVSQSGLIELLEMIKEKKLLSIIASSSSLREIETVIISLGIMQFIDAYCSVEEVEKGKPFPDIFFLAARRIQVEPKDCVVFEDTVTGLKAAKRAGMICYVVPSREAQDHDFSLADEQFRNLQEVSAFLNTNL